MSSEEIEAIKSKIRDAGYQIPLLNNQMGWNLLLNTGVLTGPEIVAITNHIVSSAPAPQPASAGPSTPTPT
eukprot:scaffold6578_cov291-Ochromonas_danica.AAC.2